jgi:addiction module RelB/DinJ family antitoxin
MKSASLVQARIDNAVKEKAEKYFQAWGIDTATAIRIYFAKVAELGYIPFTIGTDPEEDAHDAKIADEAYEEYVQSGYQSSPIEELYKKYDIH